MIFIYWTYNHTGTYSFNLKNASLSTESDRMEILYESGNKEEY